MHKIILSEEGKKNIQEIQSIIAGDNLLSSVKVINSIFKTIEYLENFPEIGTPLNNEIRQLVEPKYKIIYISWGKGTILILNIVKYQNIY